MRMVVIPRVGYTGQGANLTESQIQKLDSVTLAYARKDLKLLVGFPTAPLIHHQLINHPLPSSIYYEARLGSLWRNLGRAGRPSIVINEHLDRALRTRGMDSTVMQPLQLLDIKPIDGGNYWINGLLEGLQRSELYLHRGGAPALTPTTRQLLSSWALTDDMLTRLRQWGINTWADLLTPEARLTTELHHLLPQALQLPTDMEIEPPQLRQGQFWYKTVDIAGPPLVIEIMAVDATSYQYREWLPTVQGM